MKIEKQRIDGLSKKAVRNAVYAALISLMSLFGSQSFAQQNKTPLKTVSRPIPKELSEGKTKNTENENVGKETKYIPIPKELLGTSNENNIIIKDSLDREETPVVVEKNVPIVSKEQQKEFMRQREWLKNRYSNPSIQKKLAEGNEYIVKRIVSGKEKILKDTLEYDAEEKAYGVEKSSGFFYSKDSTIRVMSNDSLVYIHEKTHQCVKLSPAQKSWILQFAAEEYVFVTEEHVFNNIMTITEFYIQEEFDRLKQEEDSTLLKLIQNILLMEMILEGQEATENFILPQEIYARIVEFRYIYGIKPGEKVTLLRLKEINQGVLKKLKEVGSTDGLNLNDAGYVLLCIIYGKVKETNQGLAISIDLERLCTLLNTLP